jgi:hypothetical protein
VGEHRSSGRGVTRAPLKTGDEYRSSGRVVLFSFYFLLVSALELMIYFLFLVINATFSNILDI